MSDILKDKIAISAVSIEALLDARRDMTEEKLQKLSRAFDEMEAAFENYKRLATGAKELKLFDIVKPLPGWNMLRAGETAYNRAVVMSLEPFGLLSEDGKFDWHRCYPETFEVVGKVTDRQANILNLIWKTKQQ